MSHVVHGVTETKPVPREAVLIVNAHSRTGQASFDEARRLIEEAGIRLIAAHPLEDPSKLNDTVREAVRQGAPMVIVGGGDGSLSCAVDDLVDRDCVFAVLPLGTANSFARTIGIPLDLPGAVQAIATGRRKRIDLGVINGDYYANAAAIGLSPLIGNSVPHKLKKYLGRVGYLIWATWCLFHFKPFKLTVEADGKAHRMSVLEVRIANGRFHGGVEILDDTDVDSGDIVVQAVVGHYRTRLIWNWLATYFKLPQRHDTTVDYRGKRLRVVTEPPLPISIDGEVLAHTPADVCVAERAIEVVVPARR